MSESSVSSLTLPSESRLCKESISPETVGSILQAIADLLSTATSETKYNVLRFWKDTISQFQFLYDIQQRNVSDHSNVILALMGRRMASGETFSLTLPIGPASRTQAGVMTAEDYILLHDGNDSIGNISDTLIELMETQALFYIAQINSPAQIMTPVTRRSMRQ